MRFGIITCSRDDGDLLARCVASVELQSHTNWEHVVVIDSAPGAFPMYDSDQRTVLYNDVRMGAAANIWLGISHLRQYRSVEVIVMLDGDDMLTEGALEFLNMVYEEDPELWLTWGSYRLESGAAKRLFSLPFENVNVRAEPWRASHLKAFRTGLANHIVPEWFKMNGAWLQSASDLALMMPLLELSGPDHRSFISKVLYIYNDINPYNDHKIAPGLQKTCEREIRGREPLKRLESL